MEPRFAPPGGVRWIDREAKGEPTCQITLTAVRDGRADTQSMGMLGLRVVRAADSAAWLRAGFEALTSDARIALAKPGHTAGLSLSIELLKAHVASVNMAKTANVVVRVTFAAGTADASDKMFRGEATDVNWGSGDNEALDLMNIALAEIVAAAHADVIDGCAANAPGS